MADFEIEVGFNTKKLDKTLSDFQNLGGGSTKGVKGGNEEKKKNIIAGGVGKVLKVTGIVAAIASIAFFTESIAFLVGSLVALTVIAVREFLGDPFRALLKLGVFIVNGFLSGIEFLIKGTTGVDVDLPRFQLPKVLEAYDEFKESMIMAAEDGIVTNLEAGKAFVTFAQGMIKSFITNTEFQKELDEEMFLNQLAMKQGFDSVEDLAFVVDSGAAQTANQAILAFDSAEEAFAELERLANELNPGGGGGAGGINVFAPVLTKGQQTQSPAQTTRELLQQRTGGQTDPR